MDTVQIIVEGSIDSERENYINTLGNFKYYLPIINSYVIEVPQKNLAQITKLKGVKAVYKTTHITAQMNSAKKTVKADKLNAQGHLGKGVTIAILDTGISPVEDFTQPKNRIVAFKDFINGKQEPYDDNGHGTHVAGIAAGNGSCSGGKYAGIAPNCDIVAVKVLDKNGSGISSDVLAGLQWIIDNKDKYNIRIINLSVGTNEIYTEDPLVRGVEEAWNKGVVMTIAAGNNGPDRGSVTSPGISRKVITVGASDDNKSVKIWGNVMENYSGRGPTVECIIKPDVIAPGGDIISCLTATLPEKRIKSPNTKIVSKNYIQMSGTSMSTPIVTGAIALLLEKNPKLKPNDIKLLLKKSSQTLNYSKNQQGWGLLNIERLLQEDVKDAE